MRAARCFGVVVGLALSSVSDLAAQQPSGLRGDPAAIAEAESMVEAMGGLAIWREVASVHFVHEWDIFNRPDIYLENEILDLTGPRSYVTMESESNAMERAPYSLYRIARAVARGDRSYEVQFRPMRSVPGTTGLEFEGPDGAAHGWILLNTRKEPVVWATTQYSYSFGPLRRFGNLRVPGWGVTGEGRVRYEMVSLTGSKERPDSSLFAPPPEHIRPH